MAFGYGLLRGRQGAEGYIRETDGKKIITARHLSPGREYALYALLEGSARRCCVRQADGAGDWQGESRWSAPCFLADETGVKLWEGDEEDYLRACACLGAMGAAPRPPQTAPSGQEAPALLPRPSGAESREEKGAKPSPAEEPPLPVQKQSAPAYRLRPPGEGEAVDGLPALRWPRGMERMRELFETRTPVMPLNAPGWRFVRAPSPVPGAAWCAVGYLARDAQVRAVAYAVPGGPYRPPAPLPGYRYHPGRDGGGYWVRIEQG